MLGRSHAALGAVAGSLTAQTDEVSAFGIAVCAALGAVAGLVPDLDHPRSLLGRHLPTWWHRLTPGHRRITHSPVWATAAGLLVTTVAELAAVPRAELLGWVVAVGILTHLVGDAVTEQGIPWLWPLSRRRVALPAWAAIKTGGLAERLLVAGLLAAGVIQLTSGWDQLSDLLGGS